MTHTAILSVAFTPKGGCLLKREVRYFPCRDVSCVAFTPKGGCPLKLDDLAHEVSHIRSGSIHPQGWVRGGRMVVAMHSASTVRVKLIVATV